MQNTIYGGENAHETQGAITHGGRARVAGAWHVLFQGLFRFSGMKEDDTSLPLSTSHRIRTSEHARKRIHNEVDTHKASVADDTLFPSLPPPPSPPLIIAASVISPLHSTHFVYFLNSGHNNERSFSPFATEATEPRHASFDNSPRLNKNKNSKFDVGCAKVGAGGFDAQRSRYDYESQQAAAAQMKARQLGGAGSFLSHD